MKILTRIYLVLAILLAIVWTVQCVRWSGSPIVFCMGFFLLLPVALVYLTYTISRDDRRTLVHVIAIPVCLAALFFFGLTALVTEVLATATTNVTTVGKYEKILDDYWKPRGELTTHFPRPIPPQARDVRFSFRRGFLQGGSHIQLRYSLPDKEMSDLYERFSRIKTKSFTGGDMNDHMNMKEGMPTTFFHTNGSKDQKFPADFEVMIFDEVMKGERPEGFYWNHARCHGVAISRTRHEIVYWAESW